MRKGVEDEVGAVSRLRPDGTKLKREIAALGDLSRDKLAQRWVKAYGVSPPKGVKRGLLGGAQDMDAFIRGELRTARRSLLERNTAVAVRRIAFAALWQPLIPFDQLEDLTASDLSPLLEAEDPFTLLFGFEVCRALLEKDSAFVDLGSAFLRKLLGDAQASDRRYEMFSACAIVATIEIRRAAKTASAPVFWTRLAALAHAGVLANALGKMPDTVEFLAWVASNFYAHYVWNCVVDRREAPRWCPDWISPEHIFAELVGRVRGALCMLTEANRPAAWVELIDAATARLVDNKGMLTSMFPGPLDDFIATNAASALRPMLAEVEAGLDKATHLADAILPSERIRQTCGGKRAVLAEGELDFDTVAGMRLPHGPSKGNSING